MSENLFDELTWRGLISQTTGDDELRAALEAGPDHSCTADSTPRPPACTSAT